MTIRKANSNDAREIAKVQVDTWNTAYQGIVPDEYLKQMTYSSRENMWKNILSNQTVFVAEKNGEIIGFANGGKARSKAYPEYGGELYAIYIIERFQQTGIGKRLFVSVVECLKQMNILSMIVYVLEDNTSRLFYERLGANRLATVEIEIAGKKLNELVYGWKDLKEIK